MSTEAKRRGHPYSGLPDYQFWKRSISEVAPDAVDPVIATPFKLKPTDKIATAGSCFAQHISRYLSLSGYNYYVAEAAHRLVPASLASQYNYGTFTARYGNLYTSRQLLQLIERAYGRFNPLDDIWRTEEGHIVDPFRPQIQPDGFSSEVELQADRQQHFACVRTAFETLDVFVFTLGLTECWVSREDGAAFPLAPGVAGGQFDPERYVLCNLGVADVVGDMVRFIRRLRQVNRKARIILTVSPVPLIATAEPRHVLVSTTYSKSALRVACDQLVRRLPGVVYFPSYEIITGPSSRGRYFGSDCRSVTEEGVAHVMRVFMRHFTTAEEQTSLVAERVPDEEDPLMSTMQTIVDVVCEEEMLDAMRGTGR